MKNKIQLLKKWKNDFLERIFHLLGEAKEINGNCQLNDDENGCNCIVIQIDSREKAKISFALNLKSHPLIKKSVYHSYIKSVEAKLKYNSALIYVWLNTLKMKNDFLGGN